MLVSGYLTNFEVFWLMNEIEIDKYQTYKYKGLKIGIWKTADKKFIRRSWAAIYFGDRGKEIQKKALHLVQDDLERNGIKMKIVK